MVKSETVDVQHISEAASENPADVSLPYNYLLEFTITGGSQIKSTLMEMLSSNLAGCGPVDLVELIVSYQTTDAKQTIRCGVASANTDLTFKQVGASVGGLTFTSNSMNYGSKVDVSILVPTLFSKQVQPASSHAPAFKFYLQFSPGVEVVLTFKLDVKGPIFVRKEWDLKA